MQGCSGEAAKEQRSHRTWAATVEACKSHPRSTTKRGVGSSVGPHETVATTTRRAPGEALPTHASSCFSIDSNTPLRKEHPMPASDRIHSLLTPENCTVIFIDH